MLDGNVFAVFTKEDDIIGLYAVAEKIPMNYNLQTVYEWTWHWWYTGLFEFRVLGIVIANGGWFYDYKRND